MGQVHGWDPAGEFRQLAECGVYYKGAPLGDKVFVHVGIDREAEYIAFVWPCPETWGKHIYKSLPFPGKDGGVGAADAIQEGWKLFRHTYSVGRYGAFECFRGFLLGGGFVCSGGRPDGIGDKAAQRLVGRGGGILVYA